MKKAYLAFAAFLLIGTASMAQVTIGVKAGINGSNVSVSSSGTSVSYTTKIGLNAGAFADISVSPVFSVQPELTYSQMGAKVTGGQLNLDYIHLPVLAKYHFSDFAVYAGPQIGFLMSAKAKSSGNPDQDVKSQLKGTDFLGVFGAEYSFDPGIVVSARYMFGLSNIAASSSDGTIKNNGFQFTVGYKFMNGSSKK